MEPPTDKHQAPRGALLHFWRGARRRNAFLSLAVPPAGARRRRNGDAVFVAVVFGVLLAALIYWQRDRIASFVAHLSG